MLWINFLHFYQPANADKDTIIEATEKSYKRIVRALLENPGIKFTFNITGCLVLRWKEMGYSELIRGIKKLADRNQIELTGSAAYHPLLPLIPEKEIIKQVEENESILRENFGDIKLAGFFMPEMAYGVKAARVIKKMGYDWIILDEISHSGKLNEVDFFRKHIDKNSGLKVIFRSRKYSSQYVPEFLNKELEKNCQGKIYITATDGELYGLRHNDPSAEFEKFLKKNNFSTAVISEFLEGIESIEKISIIPSNWESEEREIKKNVPYFLWKNPKNAIHQKLWSFAEFAYRVVETNQNKDNYKWARWHLVRGLSSCTFWWASQKDFKHIYGPYAWNPDEIVKRINELLKAIRSLEALTTINTKIKAEKMAIDIKGMVWEKHWHLKHRGKI